MRVFTSLGLALLCLASTVTPVSAQSRTRTAALSHDVKARRHYDLGEEHYRAGRFVQALEAFAEAYQEKPLPTLLFNMGQCHMELENFREAKLFFEGYLRDKPNAKNRPLAEQRLKEAQLALAMRAPVDTAPTMAIANDTPFYRQRWFWGVVAGSVAAAAGTAAVLHWQYGGEPRPPAGSLGTVDRR